MKQVLLWLAVLTLIGFAIARFTTTGVPAPAEPPNLDSGSRLSTLLGSGGAEGYAMARSARTFHFPEDHGPHRDFRNEWWYLTGNLDDEEGRRFGYELTIFRFSLSPGKPAQEHAPVSSNWHTNQVYMAHFTVTDVKNERFHVAQRFARGALGLAGAQREPFRVWIEDWSIADNRPGDSADRASEDWWLAAAAEDFALALNLTAVKPPVLNGVAGLSQKAAAAGNASYYYSIPRLRSAGTLRIGATSYRVSGLSWLDREWSSSALAPDQRGWDWFALQLADGSDLMFYNIRKTDGSQDANSAGTRIPAGGEARHLSPDDVLIRVSGHWQSPDGIEYPARWDIRLPALDLELNVTPVIANQQLVTAVRYWEGAVDVRGRRGQQAIEGRGYVELTGYE